MQFKDVSKNLKVQIFPRIDLKYRQRDKFHKSTDSTFIEMSWFYYYDYHYNIWFFCTKIRKKEFAISTKVVVVVIVTLVAGTTDLTKNV